MEKEKGVGGIGAYKLVSSGCVFVLGGERRRSGDGILKMKIFQRRSLELLEIRFCVCFVHSNISNIF